jgi:hypothetical protein
MERASGDAPARGGGFGVGRMAGVAKALREHYPAARLVVVADAGKESQCAAIAKSVSGDGWKCPPGCPSNYDLNDLHQAEGLGAARALLEGAKEIPQRFQLLTPADLAKRPPAGGAFVAYFRWRASPQSSARPVPASRFWCSICWRAVASGADWFGCRTKAAPVLYVALEGEAGIAQRVHAYQAKHGPLAPAFRFLLQSLDIRTATDRADLVNAVQAAGWSGGVLCLDTLNRAAPGMDENDSKSMGEVIAAAKAIQAAVGGVVLVVHHTGKDAAKGLRGHSSLHAALDAAIEVTRDGDRREWKIAKSKDGEDGEAHPFRLDVVQIGEDEDGEPVTSCVVVPEKSVDDAMRRVKLPSGGNQRIVWDGLQEMFKAAGSAARLACLKNCRWGAPCYSLTMPSPRFVLAWQWKATAKQSAPDRQSPGWLLVGCWFFVRGGYGFLDLPARFPRFPPRSYIRGGEFRGFGKPETPFSGISGNFGVSA